MIGFQGISGVLEGPTGLLAYSIVWPDCGSIIAFSRVLPVALSRDGIDWQLVNVDVKGDVVNEDLSGHSVGAGPAGYVVAGDAGIFTSIDGLAWRTTDIKSAVFEGFRAFESATSIAGGFVVSGADDLPTVGCVGGSGPAALLTPALWWPPDGSTWTRQTLPNARRAEDIYTAVCRIGDLVIATDEEQSWQSIDGRSWKSTSDEVGSLCPPQTGILTDKPWAKVLTAGGSTLALSRTKADSKTVYAVRPDLSLVKLAQTGDLPPNGVASAVLGPAGLVVADDKGNVYVGVLVAA